MHVVIVKQNLTIPADESPQALLVALRAWAGLIWLADDGQPVIGLCPRWLIKQQAAQTQWQQRDTDGQLGAPIFVQGHFTQAVQQQWQNSRPDTWQLPTLRGFCGGLMGFLGYDWAAAQHAVGVTDRHMLGSNTTCHAWLACYDIFLRQESTGWQLYGTDCPSLQPLYDQIALSLHAVNTPRLRPTQAAATDNPSNRQAILSHSLPDFQMIQHFIPRWSLTDYRRAFARVQHYLQAGDCYQVNLTQAFEAKVSGCLLTRLDALLQLTRAPYASYLAINPQHELLSCSPELFLSFLPKGEVVTRPIKGTQPRHADPERDQALRQQLAHSEKDQAENLMIVDLLRNDLARQAKIGSVRVPKLFEVESFAQVHHLVSEIRATLAPHQSPLDLLFDALPGGSITGAPKIRAMQIIAELEVSQRGAYCGSMGYLNADGTGRFNILIRTLERLDTQLSVWAGGGITIASDVDQEYQECLDKVGAILDCIETG